MATKSQKDAEWRKNNAEHVKLYAAEWRKKNAERIKQYKQEHAEQIKAKDRRWYLANPGRRKPSQSKYLKTEAGKACQKRHRDKNRDFLNKIKSDYGCANPSCPCVGIDLPLCCFDFHHLDRSTKSFNLGCSSPRGREALRNEVNKCVVLCVVCHRMVTYHELDASGFALCAV